MFAAIRRASSRSNNSPPEGGAKRRGHWPYESAISL
jgi:hypothetical protein